MRVYKEIAARYGVDKTNEEAVDAFFMVTLPTLSLDKRQKILDELLAHDGEEE